jgi:hypothetical protein
VQIEVQAETEMMIPDTLRRLAKAIEDLKEYVVWFPPTHSSSSSVMSNTHSLA